MKRKLLVLFLSIVSTVCLAIGLTACGGSSSGGSTGTDWEHGIYTVETAYAEAQTLGYNGSLEDFIASISGTNGTNGTNGINGTDGVSITNVYFNSDGELIVELSSGTPINLGNISGADGVGISTVAIENGNLIITLTNGEDIDCGTVVGDDGKEGKGINSIAFDVNGDLIITYTDGTYTNLGDISGINGKDGNDGVGVSEIVINTDGELVITLTDGTVINCGSLYCSHSYGEWITGKEATCTSIGYNYRVCDICGDVDYEFIEATGHKADEYTYDIKYHYYYCTECGTYLREKHICGDDDTCAICGALMYSVDLAYTLNSDKQSYSVSGIGTCTDTDIVIPSIYNGLPVTSIGYRAFYDCTSLTDVIIGEGVTSIATSAFRGCTSLTNITLPNSITSINSQAFYNTGYYNDANNWENGVLYIGTYLIVADTSIEDSYTIKNETTLIASYAFYNCTLLTNITIPNSVIIIGNFAFNNCISLNNVTIPDSVTAIGSGVFANCSSLINISVSSDNIDYKAIDGNLYTYDESKLIQYAVGKTDTTFLIPDSVTSIGSSAFRGCASLKNITIGENIISIGSSAFNSCTSLENITIGNNVTSIGSSAFYGCTSLTNIVIPDSVASIGIEAFEDCTALTSIIIGGGVSAISEYLCCGCTSLTYIIIPEEITYIGHNAFGSCSSLATVYYSGTAEAWSEINIGTDNDCLTSAALYYYSETQPAESGNYWHYVDGEIVVWTVE